MTNQYKSIVTSPEYLTSLKKELREGQQYDLESGYALGCDALMGGAADSIEVLQGQVESLRRLLKIIHNNVNIEGMVGFREWCSGTIDYKLKEF